MSVRDNFKCRGKDVADQQAAEESESCRRDSRHHQCVAVAKKMQARSTEDQAGRQQPQPRRLCELIKIVGQKTSSEQSDGRASLQKQRRVESRFGLVQRKLVMQKRGQPAIQQPQSEHEHRKYDAQHQKRGHADQAQNGESFAAPSRIVRLLPAVRCLPHTGTSRTCSRNRK